MNNLNRAAEDSIDEEDGFVNNDSLFMLPLSVLPLANLGLRNARLIKNSRLEGVVELFSGEGTGSGQVLPKDLHKNFQFEDKSGQDMEIVQRVADLPSYDVYSLRIGLRSLNIDVDNNQNLRLSGDQVSRLNDNMQGFITPLINSVFGDDSGQTHNFKDLVSLIGGSDQEKARENLMKLSDSLGVPYTVIPTFLQDYGDVYMSLAYYRFCLDRIRPGLANFFEGVGFINRDPQFSDNKSILHTCNEISGNFRRMLDETNSVLDIFKSVTDDMWTDISGEKFQIVEAAIRECQVQIGAALCALTVKSHAWNAEFRDQGDTNMLRKVEFLMGEMRQGIDSVAPIEFVDFANSVDI